MKKKIVSTLLCTAMLVTMMAGCGGNNAANTSTNSGNSSSADTGSSDAAATDEAAQATEAAASDASASDEGKVLNIYCWNEEFKSRVTDHYPGYTEVDATTGTIGDVTVKWNITPNDDNAYQNNLDATLLKQADAAADDKIDIFLVEADYALKYVDTDYTMAVTDLGITDEDLSKQYQYTKDVVTDSNGVLKGVSWQGCPGVLFYNRDAAKAVLGSDDPSEVQNYVKDWDTFKSENSEPVTLNVDNSWVDIISKGTGIDPANISVVAYQKNSFQDKASSNILSKASFWVQIVLAAAILGILVLVIIRSARPLTVEEKEPELSVEEMLASTRENQPSVDDIDLQEKSETRKAIEKFVDENPEAVALLLRNWLNEDWN